MCFKSGRVSAGSYLSPVNSAILDQNFFPVFVSTCGHSYAPIRTTAAASFVTARWLVKLSYKVGYEIIESHDVETGDAFTTHVSWIEVKKPGNLRTVKAAQAIAQIIVK